MANVEETITIYNAVLLRDPTDAELAAFVAASQTAEGQTNAIEGLATSEEAVDDVYPFVRIYQAVFGRVPDAAGLEFWVDAMRDGLTLQTIVEGNADGTIAGFKNSAEFVAEYGEDVDPTSDTFITALYQNLLGREPDAEGLEFFTSLPDTATVGDVVAAFTQSPEFGGQINAQIEIFLERAGAGTQDYEGSVYDVNDDGVVDETDQEIVDGTFSPLAQAVENLQAAEEAVENFLADTAVNNEDVSDELVADGIDPEAASGAEVEAAIDDVLAAAVTDVDTLATAYDFTNASTSVRAAIIADVQAENAERVEDAQAAVADEEGLEAAINALTEAQAAYGDAAEAQGATNAELVGAIAEFNAIPANAAITAAVGADYPTAADSDLAQNDVIVADGGTAVITVDAGGNLVIADAYADAEGIDDLFAAVSADVNAIQDVTDAIEGLEEEVADVLDIEAEGWNVVTLDAATVNITVSDQADPDVVIAAPTLYTAADGTLYVGDGVIADGDTVYEVSATDVTAITALGGSATDVTVTINSDTGAETGITAADYTAVDNTNTVDVDATDVAIDSYIDLTASADGYVTAQFGTDAPLSAELSDALNDAEDFNEAVADYEAAQDLAGAVDDLQQGVVDAVDAVEAFGYVVDDNNVGSDDNDLFVYAGADATITDFGAEGDDQLFIGDGFARVDLEAGVNIADSSQGDVAALEVFFQQQGNDTVLYVEGNAFEGNATNGFEGGTIILADVDADTLTIDSNGFISVADSETVA